MGIAYHIENVRQIDCKIQTRKPVDNIINYTFSYFVDCFSMNVSVSVASSFLHLFVGGPVATDAP